MAGQGRLGSLDGRSRSIALAMRLAGRRFTVVDVELDAGEVILVIHFPLTCFGVNHLS